jgi:hypothetical protein
VEILAWGVLSLFAAKAISYEFPQLCCQLCTDCARITRFHCIRVVKPATVGSRRSTAKSPVRETDEIETIFGEYSGSR